MGLIGLGGDGGAVEELGRGLRAKEETQNSLGTAGLRFTLLESIKHCGQNKNELIFGYEDELN